MKLFFSIDGSHFAHQIKDVTQKESRCAVFSQDL